MARTGARPTRPRRRAYQTESAAHVRHRVYAKFLNRADGPDTEQLRRGRRMGIRLTARQALVGYVVVMTSLVATGFASAGSRTWAADAINAVACAAMLAGVAYHRPASWVPWLLLAAANLVTFGYVGPVSVLKYPLLIAALLLFIRARPAGRDRRESADTLVPALGIALLAWFLLVMPNWPHPPLSPHLR